MAGRGVLEASGPVALEVGGCVGLREGLSPISRQKCLQTRGRVLRSSVLGLPLSYYFSIDAGVVQPGGRVSFLGGSGSCVESSGGLAFRCGRVRRLACRFGRVGGVLDLGFEIWLPGRGLSLNPYLFVAESAASRSA